jgi:hypothetical protein
MPQNIRRRLFGRVVLWDTKGGTIIDLPSRNVLSFGGPSESEEYARLASGDREVVSRSHIAQIPITRREAAEVSEVLQKVGCPFKAAFLGINGTDSWMWLEPTKLQVTDPEVSAGQLSEKVLELNTNVFYPAIWEGMSLIEGVPWRGTSEQTRNGNSVLRSKNGTRPGYEGPLWNVPSGTSVDLTGNADTIGSNNPATVKIEFPAWNCKLEVESEENITATIEAQDWGGNIISSGNPLRIPDKTWYVNLIVESANRQPHLNQTLLGESYGVLEGNVSEDCSRVANPLWSETGLVITGENV